MEIKETKKITIRFSPEDKKLVTDLIVKHLGDRTLGAIYGEEFSYVFHYYADLFYITEKLFSDGISSWERGRHPICDVLSRGYNDPSTPDSVKAHIKELCDALAKLN